MLQVLALPKPLAEGTTEQQVYLLLPCAESPGSGDLPAPAAAAVLPDTAAAREAAAAAAPTMSFWQADSTTGALLFDISCSNLGACGPVCAVSMYMYMFDAILELWPSIYLQQA